MAVDLAYCGLNCAECGAYHAVERLTVEERLAVAARWDKEFGGNHKLEDIDCPGCTVSEGHHFPFCSECAVRLCASGRSVPTCAECADYACASLAVIFGESAEARNVLEARRAEVAG